MAPDGPARGACLPAARPIERGEGPRAKVRLVGSALPAAGASTGRLLRARRLRRPERAQPRGPRRLGLQPPPSHRRHLHASCRQHGAALPGPADVFPARTCGADPPSHRPNAPRNPHFRFSRLLDNQARAGPVTAAFRRRPR